MAEGGQEDDSGDVTTMSSHKLDAGDAPLNLKSEVSCSEVVVVVNKKRKISLLVDVTSHKYFAAGLTGTESSFVSDCMRKNSKHFPI